MRFNYSCAKMGSVGIALIDCSQPPVCAYSNTGHELLTSYSAIFFIIVHELK